MFNLLIINFILKDLISPIWLYLQKTHLQKITAIWRGHGQKAIIWIRLINPEITQQRKKGYGSVGQEKKKEMVAPVVIMATWEIRVLTTKHIFWKISWYWNKWPKSPVPRAKWSNSQHRKLSKVFIKTSWLSLKWALIIYSLLCWRGNYRNDARSPEERLHGR